ncbi:MAG: hypothetical protein OJF48_001329 [Afipia sp.]|jgi:hypothetical protein|nr:MAG: hypothetical protein OJF48_001329 [Afipia sp.]
MLGAKNPASTNVFVTNPFVVSQRNEIAFCFRSALHDENRAV